MHRWLGSVLVLAAASSLAGAVLLGGRGGAGAAAGGAAATSGGLVVSTVSSSAVQRQPGPGSCHARGRGLYSLPDPHCTPGAIDPAVTQADIRRTICRAGYSESVRPPESVTEPEKRASLRAYGDHRPLRDYEYDHLLSGRRREGAIVLPACSLVGMPAREVG
jgi:hypothetical protein